MKYSVVSRAAPAPTAPHLSLTSFEQLPKPLPQPYVAALDAKAAIADARRRAIRSHKRVLIDLGGNWCLDCRLLAGVMERPTFQPWLLRHYEIVTVDVGRFDRNLDIPAHYGASGKLAGVPAVLVIDPKSDRLINSASITALADARSLTPQALADWLAQWVS